MVTFEVEQDPRIIPAKAHFGAHLEGILKSLSETVKCPKHGQSCNAHLRGKAHPVGAVTVKIITDCRAFRETLGPQLMAALDLPVIWFATISVPWIGVDINDPKARALFEYIRKGVNDTMREVAQRHPCPAHGNKCIVGVEHELTSDSVLEFDVFFCCEEYLPTMTRLAAEFENGIREGLGAQLERPIVASDYIRQGAQLRKREAADDQNLR